MTRSADPLYDTLFRPTTPDSALASAAPVRVTGTRSRAGNAMSRTRVALLDGARRRSRPAARRSRWRRSPRPRASPRRRCTTTSARARPCSRRCWPTRSPGWPRRCRPPAGRGAHRWPRRRVGPAPGAAHSGAAGAGDAGRARLRRHERRGLAGRPATRCRDCLARAGRGGAETVLRLAGLVHRHAAPGAASVAADVEVLLAGLPTAPARWTTDSRAARLRSSRRADCAVP